MSELPSWQFPGGPASPLYAALDRLRRSLNDRLVEFLTTAIGRRDLIVVEAGSGPASGSSVFRRRPAVRLSVAADLDMDALREARRRDPALPAIVADIVRLPFRTGSIDLVWNSSTFEHLDDGGGALAEMTRVTKPGGHVFIGVPYRSGPLGFQRWIARTAVGHWIGPVFGVGQLRRLVEAAQLRAVAMRVYFFRFFVGVLAVKPAAASAEAPRGGDSV